MVWFVTSLLLLLLLLIVDGGWFRIAEGRDLRGVAGL